VDGQSLQEKQSIYSDYSCGLCAERLWRYGLFGKGVGVCRCGEEEHNKSSEIVLWHFSDLSFNGLLILKKLKRLAIFLGKNFEIYGINYIPLAFALR
jgi:hypothetical protein